MDARKPLPLAWKSSMVIWIFSNCLSTTLLNSGTLSSNPLQSQMDEEAHPAGAYTRPLAGSTKRFVWGSGCISGCVGGVQQVLGGIRGVFRVFVASETAQVELKSGQV